MPSAGTVALLEILGSDLDLEGVRILWACGCLGPTAECPLSLGMAQELHFTRPGQGPPSGASWLFLCPPPTGAGAGGAADFLLLLSLKPPRREGLGEACGYLTF